jgi:sugar phosphate isomerase/epimerase
MPKFTLNTYVSLWNYLHYSVEQNLETLLTEVRSYGYGIELWPYFKSLNPYRPSVDQENNLFEPEYQDSLQKWLKNTPSSWHGRGVGNPIHVTTFEGFKEQIDTAAMLGSEVISVHDIGAV